MARDAARERELPEEPRYLGFLISGNHEYGRRRTVREYINTYGEDMPAIREWCWPE